MKEFKGNLIDKKMVYNIKIQNYFSQHAWYYNIGNINYKHILTAEETLSNNIAKKWYIFKQDGYNLKNIIQDKFDKFLV